MVSTQISVFNDVISSKKKKKGGVFHLIKEEMKEMKDHNSVNS